MQRELKLSALDGYVVIDGDSVSIMEGKDIVIQVSYEEWETLRESLRLDDVVDYKNDETPMTPFQFRLFVDLVRENKKLKAEKEHLLSSRSRG